VIAVDDTTRTIDEELLTLWGSADRARAWEIEASNARTFKTHGALEEAIDTWWTPASGQLTSLMREASLIVTAIDFGGPEPELLTVNWDDYLSRNLLDYRGFLYYVYATGTVAAPWRRNGEPWRQDDRPTVVLTYRDTRRRPYLAGLLRASGWRVVEMHPYEDALITGLDESALSPVAGSWERSDRLHSRTPCGRRRRQRPPLLDTAARTACTQQASRERSRGVGGPGRVPRSSRSLRRLDDRASRGGGHLRRRDGAPAVRASLPDLVALRGLGQP
jgi:hypothetical protein